MRDLENEKLKEEDLQPDNREEEATKFSDLPLGAQAMTVGKYIGLGLASLGVGFGMVSTVGIVPPNTGAIIHESVQLDERGILDFEGGTRYIENETDGSKFVLRLPVPFSSYEEVSLERQTVDIDIPVGQLATYTGQKADAAKEVYIHGQVSYSVENLAQFDARTDYHKLIDTIETARINGGNGPLSEQEKDAIWMQFSSREGALKTTLEYVGAQVVQAKLNEYIEPVQKQYKDEATLAAFGGEEAVKTFERDRVPYFKGELKKAAEQFYQDIQNDSSQVVEDFEASLHMRGQGKDMHIIPSFEDVYGVQVYDIDGGGYELEVREGN